ncbi:hypothetical protein RSAG8_05379, partial [Rhizoctonia solani AG-8 WAC10335]
MQPTIKMLTHISRVDPHVYFGYVRSSLQVFLRSSPRVLF